MYEKARNTIINDKIGFMAYNAYQQFKTVYKDKKVLIVGLGILGGGIGLAKFFSDLGAKVVVTDKKSASQLAFALNQLKHFPIEYHLGGHPKEIFLQSDLIFKGPFVPWNLPQILEAEKKGIPVEMELSFFAKFCPAKIIGITGTRGKSTTTTLIYKILKQYRKVYLGGSLPHVSTINYLKHLTEKDWMVIELPSWPLSGFHRDKFSPHIAVFTNFYPDHLNYYKNQKDYLYDKKAIYLYQKPADYLVINKKLKKTITADRPLAKISYFSAKDFPAKLDLLKGEHNQENAAAALTVSNILGFNKEKSIAIIKKFRGLPFRQQIVGKKDYSIFINDTTSTTPIATIKAINSFSDKKIVLILGGNSKNLPASDLLKHLIKVDKIVLLTGSFTQEILPELMKKFPNKLSRKIYSDLEEAVKKSYEFAQKNKGMTYILFSPAATSFASFNNEFHRGEEFNRIISRLP